MRPRLIRTPGAEQDLIDIWVYTAERWGADQADDYLDSIDAALKRLLDHPESGSDSSAIREGYRRLGAGQHRIYYRFRAGIIEVARILHVSRDADSLLDG